MFTLDVLDGSSDKKVLLTSQKCSAIEIRYKSIIIIIIIKENRHPRPTRFIKEKIGCVCLTEVLMIKLKKGVTLQLK